MIPQFNAIVLDVIVVAIILLPIVMGAIKGIKHTIINFLLLLGAFLLSFTSLTNILKSPIEQLISSNIEFAAGVSDGMKLGICILYPFVASFLLTILIYVLLRVIKCIIVMLIRKNRVKNNKLPSQTTKASRISGAIASLVLYGAFVVIGLSMFANPLVGGNKTIERTYVTKYVESVDNKLVEALSDEKLFEEKIFVKLLCGDILVEVSDDDAIYFADLAKLINEDTLSASNLDNVQQTIDFIHGLLYFTANYAIDEDGVEVDGFEDFVDLTRDAVTKSINNLNGLHTQQQLIDADNTLALSNLLKKMKLEKMAEILESVFIIK